MKSLFREYLHLERGERSAILVLLFLILLLLFARLWLVDYLFPPDHKKLVEMLRSIQTLPEKAPAEKPETKTFQFAGFTPFDPNSASIEQLKANLVPPNIAERIIRFRKAGGEFRSKKDLGKIYGFPPGLLDSLTPFIRIAEKEPAIVTYKEKEYTPYVKKEIQPVDLNTCDSAALENLPGIGPAFASRIIRFRESLGGFHSAEQLSEVYGITPETLEKIIPYLNCAKAPVRKLNLNTVDFAALSQHPYISYKTAKHILAFRDQHGKFKRPEDLLEIHTINDSLLQKLLPYLYAD